MITLKKYTGDILGKFNMQESKLIFTSMTIWSLLEMSVPKTKEDNS